MSRSHVWLAVKTAVAAILVVGVGWHFARILQRDELWEQSFALRPEFLAASGLLYLAAHTIWATFSLQLLWSQGANVPWGVGVRAYFVSQFGKYVPGKVMVIVLRMMILRRHGVSEVVAGVTATYEALTSMAAGALIGVALLPWAGFGSEDGAVKWAALVAVGGLPLGLGVLNKLAARVAKKRRGPDARPLPSPPLGLLARGLLQAAVGWCLLGLSLWACLRGLSAGPVELTGDGFLEDLAAVALSYVAGFVMLVSPGGLGAREWVLQQVLTRQLAGTEGAGAAGAAVVAALVLRLVWTAFEVTCALALMGLSRPAAAAPSPGEPVAAADEGRHG